MKVLWLVPKWTFPVTDGARVATDSLLRNTIAAGALVDVVCLAGAEEECDVSALRNRWEVNEVHVLRRNLPDSRLLKMLYYFFSFISNPFIPLTFASFNNRRIKDQLYSLLDMNSYDCIILDGLHLGTLFLRGDGLLRHPGVSSIVYRAHNIETDLWKKAHEKSSNALGRFLLKYQSLLVEKVERKIIAGSDAVAPIAQEDFDVIREMFPSKVLKLVPLGMNFETHPPKIRGERTKFLFIGRLDWPPNKDGLEWILREVWSAVVSKRPDAILKIVGSGDGSWLEKYRYLPGLEIKGFVKEIKDAYEDCHFTIVPITYGSGTRIKVIESYVMNRRLISTRSGVQGAQLRPEDYIAAETTEDWIRILSEVSLDEIQERLITASRERIVGKYCERQIGRDFYDWMRTFSYESSV